MPNRQRAVSKRFYLSEKELELINQNMARAGTTNFSLYARKMLTEGQIIKRDFTEIKALTKELANLARNINQIALRANETRSVYARDVEDLRRMYGEVKSKVSERLVKMIRE